MPDERSHYRTLRKAFLRRFTEHEFLASGGDIRELLINLIAVLAAFGLCLSYLLLYKYKSTFALGLASQSTKQSASWSDYEFLMSMTIAVAGVFVIICWDALFPDRTDCLVLTALPVRLGTVAAAKLAAVGTVFGFLVGGANIVPLIALPLIRVSIGSGLGVHRYFIAQLAATLAASLFVFAAAAAVQGVLINLLPYRLFRRASAWMQLAAVFVLLALFFATPGGIATPERLSDPANRWALTLMPSFWFFGLCLALLGSTTPVVLWLAKIALIALFSAVAVAIASYAFGYARYVRRAVEETGIAPALREGSGLLRRLTDRFIVRTARERAIYRFVWRTMTRSRTHRLIFAGYMSAGLVYLALGNIGLVEGRGLEGYFRPDAASGAIPLVLSFFALVGMRALFSVPVDLRANWVFRMNEQATPHEALGAVRKLMFVACVLPAVLFALPVYSFLWGAATGARFAVLVLLILLIVLEKLMRDFRKLPFTCAYLPGKSNLKLKLAMYAVMFILATTLTTWIAVWAADDNWGFTKAALACAAWLGWMIWRRRSASGWDALVYDERPDWQPVTLELT